MPNKIARGNHRDAPATKAKRAERRAQVASMWVRGVRNIAQISRTLGVHQNTIRNDLKLMREEWQRSSANDTAVAQADLIHELQELRVEAWSWFKRTRKPKVRQVSQKTVGAGKDGSDKDMTMQEMVEQAGDGRFFGIITNIISEEAKIRGIPGPQVQDATDSVMNVSMTMFPPAMLDKLYEFIESQVKDERQAIGLSDDHEIQAEFVPEQSGWDEEEEASGGDGQDNDSDGKEAGNDEQEGSEEADEDFPEHEQEEHEWEQEASGSDANDNDSEGKEDEEW